MMKRIVLFLLGLVMNFQIYGQVDTSSSKFWMMTYFVSGEAQNQDFGGPRLAFSSDTTGVKWQIFGNTSPEEATSLFKPILVTGADNKRCRDPMIAYDADNRMFQMVWTVSWTGKVIGYDTSSLLKPGSWGPQIGLNVSSAIPNSSFSWAPEIFWDDIQNKWMIYWSVSQNDVTKRIYYSLVTGSDFRTFGTPSLLFDPGHHVIDANIVKVGPANYYMFYKDERTTSLNIRRASGATTPQGPYTKIAPIVTNASTEGPSAILQGVEYHVFVDHYTKQGIRVAYSKNIDTSMSPWPERRLYYGADGTSEMRVSHCNVIEVPKMLVKWMLHNDSAWVRYVQNKTAVKELKMVPSSASNPNVPSIGGIKTFDLLGKVVNIDRVAIPNGAVFQSTGHRPPGFYISLERKKK